jgi:hypothetical protein
MSIIGIAFMLCMMVFFIRLFLGKMDESAGAHTPGQSGQSARPPRPH